MMTSTIDLPRGDDGLSFATICTHLSDRSPQPIAAVSGEDYAIRYANPAFCRLLQRDIADLLGRPFGSVIAAPARQSCEELLTQIYRGDTSGPATSREGDGVPIGGWSYLVWPVLTPNACTVGLMVQVTDTRKAAAVRQRLAEMNESLIVASMRQHELTETSERLNVQLAAANQAKSQFLATMSHEIRTPINAIMGFSELLSSPDLTDADRSTYGARIRRSAQVLLRLIDDILDLSKVEAGKLEIEKIEVNLPELLADVTLIMKHLAEEKGLDLSVKICTPLPQTILSDPTRFKQILTNIIGNAVKFTAVGGVRVAVNVEKDGKHLRIIVEDTGPGITAEQMPRLFMPFAQGDATTTRRFGGTGLGLDLSRRLAQALSGNIIVVKSPPGAGSIFEITLALEGAKYRESSADPGAPSREVRLDGIRVLLAEDVVDNQILITKYLSLAGATVDTANNGAEAVAKALVSPYDLILMDIQMPVLDGYAATSELRKRGYKGPVVALTAHAMRHEIEMCRFAGCEAHLSKPIARIDLVDMVRKITKDREIGAQQTAQTVHVPSLH